MASRRMKMKVVVNVTRSGRNGDRADGGPATPIPSVLSDNSSSSTGATHEVYPIQRSPVKHVTEFSFPDRSNSPIAARFRTTSNSSVEDESHTFNEEEVAEIILESEPETVSAFSEISASLASATLSDPELCDQRAPGTESSMNTTSILSDMKKEIAPIHHVANQNTNETPKQKLQKGTSPTKTKYSIVRKEFLTSMKNKVPEAKDLTILHYTFYNPPGAEDKEDDEQVLEDDVGLALGEDLSCDSMNTEEKPKKHVGPRVKVGPDGELIIDEQSLVAETSENQRAMKKLAEMKTVAGTSIFKTRKTPRRGTDWSTKETVKFYKALTMCGTDFSMMGHLFPNRTRGELKAKFKREDRKSSSLVSQALSAQTFDPNEPMTDTESEDELPHPPKRRKSSANSKDKEKAHAVEEQVEIICQSEEQSKGAKGKLKPRKRRVSLPKGRPGAIDSSMKLPEAIITNENKNERSLKPNKRESKSLDSLDKIADRDIHVSDNDDQDGVEILLEITPCY